MKKIITLVLIGFIYVSVLGQTNTFPQAGSVGIGTVNPTNKLDVHGHIYIAGDGSSARLKTNLSNSTYSQELKFWNNKLAYVWGGGIKTYFSQACDIWFGDYGSGTGENAYQLDARIGATKTYNAQNINELYIQTGGTPRMWVFGDGNISIGVRENTGDRLIVQGTIRATEIKVVAQTADFVFEDDYQLKSLEEVEQFIQTNSHLPDIPSAKEMKVEGVNVAEMNKLLLLKVEELTLYAIEQEKKIHDQEQRFQQKDVEAMKQNQILENRLAKLESLILKQ